MALHDVSKATPTMQVETVEHEGFDPDLVLPEEALDAGAEVTEPLMKPEDRTKALNDTYTETMKWLRDKYLDEFNAKRKELCDERGIAWTPPLTALEKAKAQVEKLIADNPGLAGMLGS